MPREQLNVRLPSGTINAIRTMAEAAGLSQADIVNEAVIRYNERWLAQKEVRTMNMPETLRWSEPGWYAPVQEQGVVVWYWVPAQDGPDIIPETRSFGLGTPRWFDSEEL